MPHSTDFVVRPMSPYFPSSTNNPEQPDVQQIIDTLHMQKHPEGGYFVETDRDPRVIPSPFAKQPGGDETRNLSTTIFYLLTPNNPKGSFHRNKGRTVHTLHRGRGLYVIIHADEVEKGGKARVETFVVGHGSLKGEKLQWIVEGGKYKASFLLPDEEAGTQSGGLLISEVSGGGNRHARRLF